MNKQMEATKAEPLADVKVGDWLVGGHDKNRTLKQVLRRTAKRIFLKHEETDLRGLVFGSFGRERIRLPDSGEVEEIVAMSLVTRDEERVCERERREIRGREHAVQRDKDWDRYIDLMREVAPDRERFLEFVWPLESGNWQEWLARQ